jgi:hypothetical protein
MSMKCGACMSKRLEKVDLVNGVCPKCGADYPAITPKQQETELAKLKQFIQRNASGESAVSEGRLNGEWESGA